MGFFRPNADDIDGNWTNEAGATTLYTSIDESSASDTDYIQSPVDPVSETCRVALADATGASQPFIVRYRFNNDGTELRVRLVQGASTEIARWRETASGWNTLERELSAPEFALITDASDLFVEFTADPLAALNLDFTAGTLDPLITFTRTTTATYYNISGLIASAAIDAPRFDHDPSTLAPRGLLIEEQRTNQVLYSADLTGTGWTPQASTVTTNAATAPDGTSTADTLTTTGSPSIIYQVIGASNTVSCYVKKGTADWVYLRPQIGGDTKFVYFNINTGTMGTVSAGVYGHSIADAGGGWWRITAGRSDGLGYAVIGIADGDGSESVSAGKTAHIWGVQAEVGSFATSYIPTTSAAVTRAADTAAMTGTDFSDWWNATEGTFVLEMSSSYITKTAHHINFNDGTADNRFYVYTSDSSNPVFTMFATGGIVVDNIYSSGHGTTTTPDEVFKFGASLKANDVAFCVNNGTVVTDTVAAMPAITTVLFGVGNGGVFPAGRDHFRRLSYYNTAKSDADLQALTSP